MRKNFSGLAAAILLIVPGVVLAAQPKMAPHTAAAPMPTRIRGTIQSFTGQTLTVTTPTGLVRIQFAPKGHVAELVPSDRAHIKPGTFLGIASAEQSDGSQRAVEIAIFPDSMRGTGEGSYPWDTPGAAGGKPVTHSRMTNGTVSAAPAGAMHSRMTNGTVGKGASGSSLTLTYKGIGGSGAQPITIPAGIPIVMIQPGTVKDLTPGAHVIVIAAKQGTGMVSGQVLVGKNGLTPPM